MRLEQSYHDPAKPEKLMEIVDRTAAAIKSWAGENPDAEITHIAAMGISGQSIAWPVSYKLGIPVVVVRKDGEPSNSSAIVGYGELRNYIVIDDLISSGDTMQALISKLHVAYMKERDDVLNYNSDHPKDPPTPEPIMPVCKAIFLTQSSRRDRPFHSNAGDIPVIGLDHG